MDIIILFWTHWNHEALHIHKNLMLSLTCTWWTWWGEQSCRWSSTDSRIDNWKNCSNQTQGKSASGNSFWMLVKTVAFIFPWFTSKCTVAEIYAVQRKNWSWQNASIHLKNKKKRAEDRKYSHISNELSTTILQRHLSEHHNKKFCTINIKAKTTTIWEDVQQARQAWDIQKDLHLRMPWYWIPEKISVYLQQGAGQL